VSVTVGVDVGSGVGLGVGTGGGVGVGWEFPMTISTPIRSRRTSSGPMLAKVCLGDSRENDSVVAASVLPATNVMFAATNVVLGDEVKLPAAKSTLPSALSNALRSGMDNGELASIDSPVT